MRFIIDGDTIINLDQVWYITRELTFGGVYYYIAVFGRDTKNDKHIKIKISQETYEKILYELSSRVERIR